MMERRVPELQTSRTESLTGIMCRRFGSPSNSGQSNDIRDVSDKAESLLVLVVQ